MKVVQTSNSPLADSNFASYVNNEEEAANSEISGQESSSVLDITNSWKIDIRNLDGNNSGTTNSSEQQAKDINVLLEETADSSTPPASDDTVYYSHPDKRGLSKMGQFFLFLICGFLIWITVAVALPHSAPANSITELKLPDPRNANVPNEMGEEYTNGYFPRGFKDYCGKNNNKFTIQPLSGDERNVVSELAQVQAAFRHGPRSILPPHPETEGARQACFGADADQAFQFQCERDPVNYPEANCTFYGYAVPDTKYITGKNADVLFHGYFNGQDSTVADLVNKTDTSIDDFAMWSTRTQRTNATTRHTVDELCSLIGGDCMRSKHMRDLDVGFTQNGHDDIDFWRGSGCANFTDNLLFVQNIAREGIDMTVPAAQFHAFSGLDDGYTEAYSDCQLASICQADTRGFLAQNLQQRSVATGTDLASYPSEGIYF